MRRLSQKFIDNLNTGILKDLMQKVRDDDDLDLQIRDNYINIYYKGNALLKLSEKYSDHYQVTINQKFTVGRDINDLDSAEATRRFLLEIPFLKENILPYAKHSLEIEYEQLIIRANNRERRNNSDYFIVDRQYQTQDRQRFDLIGIQWQSVGRNSNAWVKPCLIEVKFALNNDIKDLATQIEGYYAIIAGRVEDFTQEIDTILKQKIELGLFRQASNLLEAMKTIRVSPKIEQFEFIIVLVDYNPNSTLLELAKIAALPFAHQIKIFHSGFALWEQKLIQVVSQ